jgi:5-methylcytosine-specific restriction protein A
MSTYLLTWNPTQFPWPRLPYLVYLSRQDWPVPHDWCCEQTKAIRDGDRFFLLRRGQEPNGIVGSGTVISSAPYSGKDWRKGTNRRGRKALFVDVSFDALLDPDFDPILSKARLNRGQLAKVNWSRVRSGSKIPDDIAGELEKVWRRHVAQVRRREKEI